MRFNKIRFFLVPFFLILFTIITRFSFLDWGNGYFFNPDENNMVWSVFQMKLSNLNPNFFAYGQFPLFLSFFTTPKHLFPCIALNLRFWSAFFSSLSILFFYLIAKDIFQSKKIASIFSLLLIFTPGLIQSAHFGTTESILIFVFSANIFLSLKYYRSSNFFYLFVSALISAIGLASKITTAFFITPIIISLFFVFLKNKKYHHFFLNLLIFCFTLSFLTFIFSPFSFIKFSDFKSSMIYETSVATGKDKVFYTRQFENSIPYFFQFQKIFPYTNGIFIFGFSFIGFLIFILNPKLLKSNNKKFFLIIIPSFLYFIYAGQLFVKWSRFMSPLFFVAPFFCLFIFKKIKNIFLTIILLLILITPGIYFFQKYFYPDNRIIASNWINSNIPEDSFILSQSGDVLDLPLSNNKIKTDNFDFYQLDTDPSLSDKLSQSISLAEYILIPSRRVFKNQNNSNYPISQKYYQDLFSGQLGFNQIKTFSINKSFLLNDEDAEETWSVFDNPVIRIYKKDYAKI